MNNQLTVTNERHGWPLCRSYLLVFFKSVSVALQAEDGDCSDRWLHWAMGVLPDGDNEVLGVWTASQSDGPAWNQVFEELFGRGVERIGFVVAEALAAAESALRDAYPSAIVLPSDMVKGTVTLGASDQTPIPSFAAMSSGQYRKLMAAHEAAQTLQGLVCRAIGRHGPFSGATDAAACVLDRLQRAAQKTKVAVAAYSVADEALTGPATRRRGVRIAALSL